jgi:DNA primase
MISKGTIDRIFIAADIEEVVGEYVKLKKAGSNLKGLCPFHNEKTPSFSVSPAKGIYKCFGCGKAGNVVNFVMDYESLSYAEALRKLAGKYNIEIVEDRLDDPEVARKASERESVIVALEFAKNYFADNLLKDKTGRAVGLSYFVSRGLRDDIIEKFELGYSQDSRTALLEHAIKNGFQVETLLAAGLIKTNENAAEDAEPLKRYYDAFKDRVMFPVHSLTGKVIGFGGRRLKESGGPKYLNSAETEFYHKSEILYGMHLAKKAMRDKDECLLVEGYLDVITLFQHGLENVVASSGTSLTFGQVRLVKRFTDNITVLYDGDPAGLKASNRSIDLILEQDMNVNIAMLPEGEDPDTLCKKMGGDAFEKYIKEQSVNFVIFKANLYSEEARQDPIKKTKAIRDILESIVLIPDPLKRSAFIKECSKILDADERIMHMEAGKLRKAKFQNDRNAEVYMPVVEPAYYPFDSEIANKYGQADQETALIKSLIRYCNHPFNEEQNVITFVLNEIELDELEFENESYVQLVSECKTSIDKTGNIEESFFIRNPSTAALAAEVLSEKYKLSPGWFHNEIFTLEENENYRNEVIENLNYLKLKHVEKAIELNFLKLKEAVNEDEVMDFQSIHAQLLQIRTEITSKSKIIIHR